MLIRRLGWAGLEVEAAGHTAVVDLCEDIGPIEPFVGGARTPLPAPANAGAVETALVTHLHTDHTDAPAIARALVPDGSGLLLRPEPSPAPRPGADPSRAALETAGVAVSERAIAEAGIATRAVAPWETIERGPFAFTAVPAVDGFGDPQVSWVIEADGRRILHAGDTLFHGAWWTIALRHGPFDAVFLPVNGPLVSLPHRQPPTPFPAALNPQQAAVAAELLRARVAVPIHYDGIDKPPLYAQVEGPAGAFLAAAAAQDVPARVLEIGETLTLTPSAAPDPAPAS